MPMRTSPRAMCGTPSGRLRARGRPAEGGSERPWYYLVVEARSQVAPARMRAEHPFLAAAAGIFASTLCAFLAVGAVLPVLPRYVHGPVGAGDLAVGVVVGAFAFSAVVTRPLAGRLADSRGRRPVVVGGLLGMAGGGGVVFLAPRRAGGWFAPPV